MQWSAQAIFKDCQITIMMLSVIGKCMEDEEPCNRLIPQTTWCKHSVLKEVSEPLLHMQSPNAWQIHLDGWVRYDEWTEPEMLQTNTESTHQLGAGTPTDGAYP